jgi:type I restriction enzyme S subunit
LNIWVFYWLKNNVEYLQSLGSGTTFAEISGTVVKEIDITLPPLPEQKAIANVLSSLDDKIDLLHRQNKTLEAMAETLFRQWFIEEAKEDWEEVKVGDFVKTNEKTINSSYSQHLIEYLDTSSLTEGKVENIQLLSLKEAPSRARRLVKHNDILISTVRPNQKHFGIIKNPKENIVVSTGFCVLTCYKISPYFIYILLASNEMTEFLHSIAEGSTSTYPSLKPSDIEKIKFLLPPNERLHEFDKIASNNWNKIQFNHTQIQTLEKLRDNLLPKLMSGEVRVAYDQQDAA